MFVLFKPDAYDNATPLNELTSDEPVDPLKARAQHLALCKLLSVTPLPTRPGLPDLVYAANAGLFLPGLPEPVVLVSHFKHASRERETPHIREALKNKGLVPVDYTGADPWEGQGECKWFRNGRILVVGYGFRSTKATVPQLRADINRIYRAYGAAPPTVVGVRLTSPSVYHLDMAVCKVTETAGLVRRGAIDARHLAALRRRGVDLTEVDARDPFALNAISIGGVAVTHKHRYPEDRALLRRYFTKVVEVDVSEFEKGGGSVHCLVLWVA